MMNTGDTVEETHPTPFRYLSNGDGTAENPAVWLKYRFILLPTVFDTDLDYLIMRSGGDVLGDWFPPDEYEEYGEYAITLLDERYFLKNPKEDCNVPPDTFSSNFVGDAIENADKGLPLPDLNKYRLTPSKYCPFDANQILLQQKKWSDLVPLENPRPCKATARNIIAKYLAANPRLKSLYQKTATPEKEAINEKNLPADQAHVSEVVQPEQNSAGPEEPKHGTSGSSMESGSGAENNFEGRESGGNSLTKSQTSDQRKGKRRDLEKSTDNSTSLQDAESTIQSKEQPSERLPNPIQSLPSPPTGDEEELLTTDKDGAEKLPDVPEPRRDQTDHAVLSPLNQPVISTPRKRKGNDLPTTEAAGSIPSDSPQSSANAKKAIQPSPVRLVPHPSFGATPPRVRYRQSAQEEVAGPSSATTSNQQKPSSASKKVGKSADNASQGRHDGWISDDQDSLSENEKSNKDSASDFSVSDGETNMIKRPRLVPMAFAGPAASAKSNKSVRKMAVSRSTNSIAKAGDEDDNMSVDSHGSTRGTRKGPKVPFSREEGPKILDLVCSKDAHMYTKGNRLWQQIEEAKLFPGRTHQSLKDHWRKKVLPNTLQNKIYKISPEQLSKLQKAQKRRKWSEHANLCPGLKF